jgi:hypothetical protein
MIGFEDRKSMDRSIDRLCPIVRFDISGAVTWVSATKQFVILKTDQHY